jgi:hypothetical protein
MVALIQVDVSFAVLHPSVAKQLKRSPHLRCWKSTYLLLWLVIWNKRPSKQVRLLAGSEEDIKKEWK